MARFLPAVVPVMARAGCCPTSNVAWRGIDRYDQASVLVNAIDRHKLVSNYTSNTKFLLNLLQQLCQWFHWHAGAGKNRAINWKSYQLIDKLLKPKGHVNKDWEIYAKVYYHSCVKPEIEGSVTGNISTLCQKIKATFKSESQEIQEDIFHMKEEQVAAVATARDGGKDGVVHEDNNVSVMDQSTW